MKRINVFLLITFLLVIFPSIVFAEETNTLADGCTYNTTNKSLSCAKNKEVGKVGSTKIQEFLNNHTDIVSLNLSDCNISGDIDLSNFLNLSYVNFDKNNLTSIKLPDNAAELTSLTFSNNKVSSATLPTTAPKLSKLYFHDNNLSGTLDVSNYTSLTILNIYRNNFSKVTGYSKSKGTLKVLLLGHFAPSAEIEPVDLKEYPNLEQIDLDGCGITEFIVPEGSKLWDINVSNNNLETLDLSNVTQTQPTEDNIYLYFANNPNLKTVKFSTAILEHLRNLSFYNTGLDMENFKNLLIASKKLGRLSMDFSQYKSLKSNLKFNTTYSDDGFIHVTNGAYDTVGDFANRIYINATELPLLSKSDIDLIKDSGLHTDIVVNNKDFKSSYTFYTGLVTEANGFGFEYLYGGSVKPQFNFISATSDVYDLSKNTIDLGDELINLDLIKLNDLNAKLKIEGNKLYIMYNNQILYTYKLVGSKYKDTPTEPEETEETTDNPETGIFIKYGILGLLGIIILIGYVLIIKNSKFPRKN